MRFRSPLLLFIIALLLAFIVLKLKKDKDNPSETARIRLEKKGLYNTASMWEAVRNGDIERVRLFLQAGMSPNEKAGEASLFQEAIFHGHVEMVREFIKAGADVNMRNNYNQTPLISAIMLSRGTAPQHRYQIVEAIVQAGADVNATSDRGETPMLIAQQMGHEEIIHLLQQAGAKDETAQQNSPQNQALWQAVSEGNRQKVNELIAFRTDVNVRDSGRKTPLILAAEKGDVEIAQSLIAAGADVNARAYPSGRTALMEAAEKGNIIMVNILISAGADANTQDATNHHRTAAQLAELSGHNDVANTIRSNGGR